ncbi:MAG TPA: hypothetical protein VHB99_19585 [Pirellulales bacterium]|nr:hypothetical protein [Pirellulales bacterium]
MPWASRDPGGVVRTPESGVSANDGLRPCPAPALQPPGSDDVVHASHPAPIAIERFPAVTKPFPAIASDSPLPEVASRPATIVESPGQGPALVAPGAEMNAEREVLAPDSKSARPGLIRSTPTRPRAVERPLVSDPRAAAAARPANLQPAQPPPGLLPPLAPRSAEIEAVAKQAERQVRRGYDLAARGAIFYARSQFIQALRTIAQALDAQDGTHRHSDALGAGLAALEEAEDFVPRGSNVEADLDVGLLVRGHRTPVMKDAPPAKLTALAAQQKYYTFAQEQLAIAAGHEEAGSMALFGLGKAYGTLGAQRSLQTVAAEPKAMVYHQAALAVDAGNYLAANELAVYEARYGRFESARALLEHCASLAPQAAVWKNLARVHRSLGEMQLAAAAEARAADAERREQALAAKPNANAAAPGDIQWVDATTFAASSKPASDLQRPANAAEPKSAPPVEEAQGLLPWLPRASRQAPSTTQR